MVVVYDKDDGEVDDVFIYHFKRGRRSGLSLEDGIEVASNNAISRRKTIIERRLI